LFYPVREGICLREHFLNPADMQRTRKERERVVQPSYEMGARAATLLMDRIEGRLTRDPVVVRVVPTLVIRDSTKRY
jgi:hypothetical protein